MPLGRVVRRDVSVQLGCPRTLTAAKAVESPTVISALEPAIDHLAKAEAHSPMRTAVVQGADLTVLGAEEHNVFASQTNTHGGVPQLVAAQDGMPMIKQTHERSPSYTTMMNCP